MSSAPVSLGRFRATILRDGRKRVRVAYEDAVTFINAAFSCTGQREYYGARAGQQVSIAFLHEYMRVNYRRLYARCLAVDVNHFNRGRIITGLLATGAEAEPSERAFEGALVQVALRQLPAPRALDALDGLRRARINNRRVRAAIRDYLASRPDPDFDAVKYRGRVRALAAHAHLRLPAERARLLFGDPSKGPAFETPIFDAFRRAHFEEEAIYQLPFTVAEGFAARHRVPRARFLARAQDGMTRGERARRQATLQRADADHEVDYGTASLGQLTSLVVNLPVEARAEAREVWQERLHDAARRTLRAAPLSLGRVALVLDRSRSMQGSADKRRRPLAVALAVEALVRAAARSVDVFWSAPLQDSLLVTPYGGSDLSGPLIEALRTEPEVVLIVSDGFDNDPPRGADLALTAFKRDLDPEGRVTIVHLNPVFDDVSYAPRELSPAVPTVGLRDARDLPAALGFARLAAGTASLEEVQAYLQLRAEALLAKGGRGHVG